VKTGFFAALTLSFFALPSNGLGQLSLNMKREPVLISHVRCESLMLSQWLDALKRHPDSMVISDPVPARWLSTLDKKELNKLRNDSTPCSEARSSRDSMIPYSAPSTVGTEVRLLELAQKTGNYPPNSRAHGISLVRKEEAKQSSYGAKNDAKKVPEPRKQKRSEQPRPKTTAED
jgi:hypothetical protein